MFLPLGSLQNLPVPITAAGIIYAMKSEPGHPPISGAHHFGFSVSDLDRSIRFYCDVLGASLVRPPYGGDSPSFAGRMAIVGLGATGLDLFEHAGNGGERFDPSRTGLDHLGFATESVEDLRSGQAGSTRATSRIQAFGKSFPGTAGPLPPNQWARCLTSLIRTGFSWSSCFSIARRSDKQAHIAIELRGARRWFRPPGIRRYSVVPVGVRSRSVKATYQPFGVEGRQADPGHGTNPSAVLVHCREPLDGDSLALHEHHVRLWGTPEHGV